jgi:hypothetical protein
MPAELTTTVPAIKPTGTATSTSAPSVRAQYNYDYAGQDPVNKYDLKGTCYDWRNSDNPAADNNAVTGSRRALCRGVQQDAQRCLAGSDNPSSQNAINGCYQQAAKRACAKSSGSCTDLWRKEPLKLNEGPSFVKIVNASCFLSDIPFGPKLLANTLSWAYSSLACPPPAR